MDREKAKFILESYRPDGADASDPHFAEALKLAAEDRELGAWLADERAHDAIFADALESVDIPLDLKNEILSVLENDGAMPEDMEFDSIFSSALMGINPPSGLRDQIISAMEVEMAESEDLRTESKVENGKILRFPSKWFNFSAIAALLMIGAVFMFTDKQDLGAETMDRRVALQNVQIETGKLINASYQPKMTKGGTLSEVNQWLVSEGLPVASAVPNGLISEDAHATGGRKLVLDNGVEASLISFEKENAGGYYLMVLEADTVKNVENINSLEKMNLKRCLECPVTNFNVTSWKEADKVYMLLTRQDQKNIVELF